MNTNKDYIFDDYFDTINLNNDLKTFYDMLKDENLNETFEEETKLIDIRNDNYKRYSNINLLRIENLSQEFDALVNEIKKLYNFILPSKLLSCEKEEAEQTKKILDSIYMYLETLKVSIGKSLKLIEKENNERQIKLKNMNYINIDRKVFEDKYSDIVLYNSVIDDDIFDQYKRQLERKKYINELYDLIDSSINNLSKDYKVIDSLNEQIDKKVNEIIIKISYLEDLIKEKSKYEQEFLEFKKHFNKLIAYDDEDFRSVNKVYEAVYNNTKIQSLLSYFEEKFIEEREHTIKEENFIYEKYGIKNIKSSLDYISANYMNLLNDEDKQIIQYLYDQVSEEYNIEEIYSKLSKIVNNIWEKTITNIYSFKMNDDFFFICTNNQFIDEKHQAILITNRMLERVSDYDEYQIGFIMNFNNNIMYITENEDIMSLDYEDMSNLKTPKQIEQEFLNFKVCDRIALNGHISKVIAVYFIDDGDLVKYQKSVNLANQHKLPLIVLKKDKN